MRAFYFLVLFAFHQVCFAELPPSVQDAVTQLELDAWTLAAMVLSVTTMLTAFMVLHRIIDSSWNGTPYVPSEQEIKDTYHTDNTDIYFK